MNIQKYFLSLMLIIFSIGLSAQDQIIRKDDRVLNIRIVELTPNEVIYQQSVDDGIIYRIPKSEIKEIVFKENEDVESNRFVNNSPQIQKTIKAKSYIIVGENQRFTSFWDLEPYMIKDLFAGQFFLKAQSQRKKANVHGILALGTLVGGGFLVYQGYKPRYLNFGYILIGSLSILTSPIFGTAYIIYKIKSNKTKKKAEEAYGIEYLSSKSVDSSVESIDLGVALTQNGVGLVLQF